MHHARVSGYLFVHPKYSRELDLACVHSQSQMLIGVAPYPALRHTGCRGAAPRLHCKHVHWLAATNDIGLQAQTQPASSMRRVSVNIHCNFPFNSRDSRYFKKRSGKNWNFLLLLAVVFFFLFRKDRGIFLKIFLPNIVFSFPDIMIQNKIKEMLMAHSCFHLNSFEKFHSVFSAFRLAFSFFFISIFW